jgi:hypothetical protein
MDFLAAVDAAVDEALPASWPRVAPERLGRQRESAGRLRHAFRLKIAAAGAEAQAGAEAGDGGRGGGGGDGAGGYLGILTLPRQESGRPSAREVRELSGWRDQALARGGQLLVLYEQDTLERLDELGGLVATHLDLPHPRCLALACARGEGDVWGAAPTPGGEEPLGSILRDLWDGELRFTGPRAGRQTVGVELMRDACWCCEQPISTVTGIVFPDRQVVDWSSCDWRYYRRMLPLAEIEPRTLAALAAQVEQWLRTDGGGERITPLGVRSTLRPRPPAQRTGWAALCPDCGALRGAFLVGADRLDLLLDTVSRKTGRLSYRPWEIEVGHELLRSLAAGTELSVFACALGWRRARAAAEAGAGAERHLAGMVAGAPPSPAAPGQPAAPAAETLVALAAQAALQPATPSAGTAGTTARISGVVAASAPAAPRHPAAAISARPRRRLWRALLDMRAWATQKGKRRRS